ncbi:MAG: hypothetical protein OIF47_16810 [Marinibacterium sp.]|nr:hypothetical protein [Marinibacterium sp.]
MTKQAFLFSGIQGKFLGYLPWDVSDELERRGYDCHAFSDAEWRLFLDGGDQFDSAEALQDFLREKSKDAEHSLIVVASGAGPGGMISGMTAGVDMIVGLSAFTISTKASRAIDRRGNRIFATVDELLPVDEERDMNFHIDKLNYKGDIHLFYAGNSSSERYQAENLRNAENVTLHPQESHGHNFFDEDYTLRDVFDTVLGVQD